MSYGFSPLNFLANGNSEPETKKLKRPSKVLDGTFFTIKTRDGDSIEAMCSHCNEIKKGNMYSTGNFITHYKSKHADRLDELKNYLKKSNTSDRPLKTKNDRQPSINESFASTSGDTVSNKRLFNEFLPHVTLDYRRI